MIMIPAVTIGSVISDIDIGKRKSRIISSAAILSVYIGILEFYEKYLQSRDIGSFLLNNNNEFIYRLCGMIIFLCFCIYGSKTEHRTFTHSVMGILISSLAVSLINEIVGVYYLIGIVLHVGLDLLNRKPVNIFWPLKGSAYIGLCRSDGIINDLIFAISVIIIGYKIIC